MLRLGSIIMAVAAATFAALLAPASAAATTWGVPGNGSNVCTVPNPNCNTITQAVTASSSGDTIQHRRGQLRRARGHRPHEDAYVRRRGHRRHVRPADDDRRSRCARTTSSFQDFTMRERRHRDRVPERASNNTQITRVQLQRPDVARHRRLARGDLPRSATSRSPTASSPSATIGIRTSSTAQVAGLTHQRDDASPAAATASTWRTTAARRSSPG